MNAPDKPRKPTKSTFLWLLVATGMILLLPLVAMFFTNEVNWGLVDFVVMGILLFGLGSGLVFAYHWLPSKRRILFSLALVVGFIYLWAEFAVGIFIGSGS